jgi:RNA polymerase sigma-70 factor (ECF subfamily)
MRSDVRTDTGTADDLGLVAAVRAGDEPAFTTLVERHYGAMLALAGAYALPPAAAEEAVHGAFMTALAASGEFDGSVPLRAWLLQFAARAAAPLAPVRESPGPDPGAPPVAVDRERFRGGGDGFPGHWRAYPRDWRALPDEVLRGPATRRVVEDAVAGLPVDERTAIMVRDVLGCPPREACAVLDVGEADVRRRLHRARSHVRAALERHLDA